MQKINLYAFLILFSISAMEANANELKKIKVVTCFSILEDLVTELGGKRVSIINLVGRNSDAHIYQPKPSDAVAIAKADLVIMNGLGFEGWVARLLENQGKSPKRLVASQGVDTLISEDDIDPHAWQSFKNIRVYVDNITRVLVDINPKYKNEFDRYNKTYKQKLHLL